MTDLQPFLVLPDAVRSNWLVRTPGGGPTRWFNIYPRFLPGHETRRHRRPEGHHQPSRLLWAGSWRGRAVAVPGLQVPAGRQRLRRDISDYQDIDPLLGTLDDTDELPPRRTGAVWKIVMIWWSTTRPTSMPGSRPPGTRTTTPTGIGGPARPGHEPVTLAPSRTGGVRIAFRLAVRSGANTTSTSSPGSSRISTGRIRRCARPYRMRTGG